jgi:hypothetical protein
MNKRIRVSGLEGTDVIEIRIYGSWGRQELYFRGKAPANNQEKVRELWVLAMNKLGHPTKITEAP